MNYERNKISRAEQSRAEQSRAEQSRAEQSRAEQSRAEQSVRRLGNLNGHTGGSFAYQVFDPNGICPTLTDMQGGGRQPHIIEIYKLRSKNNEGKVSD